MKAVVIGAGKMGRAAALDFVKNKKISHVLILDANRDAVKSLVSWLRSKKVQGKTVDVAKKSAMVKALGGYDIAISCVPYRFNYCIGQAAIDAGVHLADLGGNNDVVAKELTLHSRAKKKDVLLVPDCGLAPGLVSVLTKRIVDEMDSVDEIHIRVGGLPLKPKEPFKYQLVFSVSGLINEYVEPVVVLRNGKITAVEPLSELEDITFPRPFGKLEAFTTSGGTSTLPRTYKKTIKNLDYKTIRYPGHCHQMRFLYDVGLMDSKPLKNKVVPRHMLEKLLVDHLPDAGDDVILLRVWARGKYKGKKKTLTYELIDKPKRGLSAMMRCTAFPVTIVLSLIGDGTITERGVMTQEHFVPADMVIKELAKRGVHIKRSVR